MKDEYIPVIPWRRIRLKHTGDCYRCGRPVNEGGFQWWAKGYGVMHHLCWSDLYVHGLALKADGSAYANPLNPDTP